MDMTAAIRSSRRVPLLQITKSAVAAVAAWLVAGWLIPGPLPVFAAIAALLVVQPSLNQSLSKAIERSVGVIAGVSIASLLGMAFGGAEWVILVAIVIALVIAWALRMTAPTTNQVAISAMLVLALGAATPNYALDRILETMIGAAIGIIVNLALVPPVALAPARTAVDDLAEELAASLERLAHALERPQTPAELEELLRQARLMRPMRDAAETAIVTGEDSLALNPRGRGHRAEFSELSTQLERFGPIVTQVIGMTRAMRDHGDPGLTGEPALRAIAEQLRRAAHDVRLSAGLDAATPPSFREAPALTAPLTISAPSPSHWVLIGSMLEDLHRIHEALRGENAS
ncbi:aromatic acid exporter family protein [Microbacterium sp. P01]|uniref:FUSC family protein n=1 Tax=unclassified Microbacterium TaxID=2609290 RepID=UPI00366A69A6